MGFEGHLEINLLHAHRIGHRDVRHSQQGRGKPVNEDGYALQFGGKRVAGPDHCARYVQPVQEETGKPARRGQAWEKRCAACEAVGRECAATLIMSPYGLVRNVP